MDKIYSVDEFKTEIDGHFDRFMEPYREGLRPYVIPDISEIIESYVIAKPQETGNNPSSYGFLDQDDQKHGQWISYIYVDNRSFLLSCESFHNGKKIELSPKVPTYHSTVDWEP